MIVAEGMTLAEFRKKHPSAKVRLPSPIFTLAMLLACAGFVALMIRALSPMARAFMDPHASSDLLAPFGAITLIGSFSIGTYMLAQRLGEVIGWMRKGYCAFAIADEEVILVSESGESVVFPIAKITKLHLDVHTIYLEVDPAVQDPDKLWRIARQILKPGGEAGGGRPFFAALAPRVRKLAPNASVERNDTP